MDPTASSSPPPASARRVVVTRPQPQADEWVERLVALQQPAIALPLLQVQADEAFDGAVRQAWAVLPGLRLVMFVSPNAVSAFFGRRPVGAAWPADVLAGATGPGTVTALEAAGVPSEAIAAPPRDAAAFDAETLWSHALEGRDWQGANVLIVRGETGREWLAVRLRERGAAVQVLAAYRRSPPVWTEAVQAVLDAVLAAPAMQVWLFSSSQAIDFLVDHLRATGCLEAALAVPALATHPRIAETAVRAGFTQVDTVSPYPGAVVAWLHRHPAAAPAASIESPRPPMTDSPGTPFPAAAMPVPPAAPGSPEPARPAPVSISERTVPLPVWLVRWWMPLAIVWAALTLAALVMAWQARSGLHNTERDFARRQQGSAQQAAEALLLAREAQDLVRDTAAKAALTETRLSELALQRTQLDELIQSLSRTRDESLLADVDAGLRVALQQSAITGSAEPLVAALRGADERLARAAQPRLERLRRAIARDLERVRAVGVPEIGTLMLKLDEAARLLDDAPLISNPRDGMTEKAPAAARTARRSGGADTAAARQAGHFDGWWKATRDRWEAFWLAAGEQTRQLMRVTRIDQPEAMLVAPDQAVFLRENIKLRILNARLALLSRQPEAAQGDLQMAISAVQRYFDGGSRRTQAVLELLRQSAQQSQQVGIPRPDETLAALATAAAGR